MRGIFLCLSLSAEWLPPLRFTPIQPEMVFLANFGVSLHVCLCGDLQAAAQRPDFIDLARTGARLAGVGRGT
ncbi:hypothetical protein TRIP_B200046 [uncultured Desulfatiglans sp.]|uniref:Uncharacterized protein n=1 Tax=Uncultured Desulfatiglans sp. TaxID=1748965 RepID=A0A653A1J3_UNCDX|nr:hypothetical protein TRIP_B200046 [uncultured Desulfatiglans sp.]